MRAFWERGFSPMAGIETRWGNLIIMRTRDEVYSWRHGGRRVLRVAGLSAAFIRYRKPLSDRMNVGHVE